MKRVVFILECWHRVVWACRVAIGTLFFAGLASVVLSCSSVRHAEAEQAGEWEMLQRDSCPALFTIEKEADFIATDALLNCYLALPSGELLRYDSTGALQARYGNFDRGALSDVDVSNPLRPLLFYRDFSEWVVLDPQFAELGVLSLRDEGLPDCTAVCRARDNQLWAFEASEGILYKISERGEKLLESDPLRLWLPKSSEWFFSSMRESEHYILLWAPEQGFVVFDAFARFLRFIPLEGVQAWQMLDADVFLLLMGEDKPVFFFPETAEIRPLSLPCSPFPMRQFEWQGSRYYLRSDARVGAYVFPLREP